MSCWLLCGILWTTLAAVAPPVRCSQSLSQHYRSVASYPFSKIVGVFSVVDEASCACLLISRPCPVEIAEKSVLKARGFPCPLLTRYCCHREILLDLSSSVTHRPASVTAQNQGRSSQLYTITQPPVTATDSVFPFTSSGRPEVQSREGIVHYASSQPSGTTSSDGSTSEAPVSTVSNVAQETETEPNNLFKAVNREKNFPRRPKMVACSCMTREDCISSWSFFVDLPQVDFRTSLTCDGSNEITCCMGRILPPRSHKSRDGNPGTASTTWRPLEAAWEGLVSWFNW